MLLGLLLCLSSCGFRNTDDLFSIPRTSANYLKLQDTITEEIGNSDSIAPIDGANTQTIQLVDLDHDNSMEAITFYRENSAERPLKIAIFKQKEPGDYYLYSKIEEAASEIESIEYINLADDHTLEILVSWQVVPQVNTLIAYKFEESQPPEQLMRSGHTKYLAFDINEDKKAELLLLDMDSDKSSPHNVNLYTESNGVLELNSSAPLSSGILSLKKLEAGLLQDDTPAFMVTSDIGDNKLLTDIFILSDSGLKNITMAEEEQQSKDTIRHNTGITFSDFHHDKLLKIPIAEPIPSNNPASTDKFWKINWTQYDKNGTEYKTASTYHNNTDRWSLILPDEWNNVITLQRENHVSSGERAVEFSYWIEGSEAEPEPFLVIYRFTGANRDTHAKQDGRFVLDRDRDVTYAAKFLPSNWDCGIDRYGLLSLFQVL